MSQNISLGSCFKWVFGFSMFKESVDLSRLLWLYVMLLNIPLGLHTEANVQLLTSLKKLSLH